MRPASRRVILTVPARVNLSELPTTLSRHLRGQSKISVSVSTVSEEADADSHSPLQSSDVCHSPPPGIALLHFEDEVDLVLCIPRVVVIDIGGDHVDPPFTNPD